MVAVPQRDPAPLPLSDRLATPYATRQPTLMPLPRRFDWVKYTSTPKSHLEATSATVACAAFHASSVMVELSSTAVSTSGGVSDSAHQAARRVTLAGLPAEEAGVVPVSQAGVEVDVASCGVEAQEAGHMFPFPFPDWQI